MQDDGTLVLLDFGQCKALTAERQASLARLVIALDRGWPADVAHATKACCFAVSMSHLALIRM